GRGPWAGEVAGEGRALNRMRSVSGACMAAPVRCNAPPLGSALSGPDNAPREIKSDNPDHAFPFPGPHQLSAMRAAHKGLETELPRLLAATGVEVLEESVQRRHSSNGRYVSVPIGFRAQSREQYERAHQALRDHPEAKWPL